MAALLSARRQEEVSCALATLGLGCVRAPRAFPNRRDMALALDMRSITFLQVDMESTETNDL